MVVQIRSSRVRLHHHPRRLLHRRLLPPQQYLHRLVRPLHPRPRRALLPRRSRRRITQHPPGTMRIGTMFKRRMTTTVATMRSIPLVIVATSWLSSCLATFYLLRARSPLLLPLCRRRGHLRSRRPHLRPLLLHLRRLPLRRLPLHQTVFQLLRHHHRWPRRPRHRLLSPHQRRLATGARCSMRSNSESR